MPIQYKEVGKIKKQSRKNQHGNYIPKGREGKAPEGYDGTNYANPKIIWGHKKADMDIPKGPGPRSQNRP